MGASRGMLWAETALEEVSAAGLLFEAVLLVVVAILVDRLISALLRDDNKDRAERRRAHVHGCPQRSSREACRCGSSDDRSAELRDMSLPPAKIRPRDVSKQTPEDLRRLLKPFSEDTEGHGVLPRMYRPELPPMTSSMNRPRNGGRASIALYRPDTASSQRGHRSPPSDSEPKSTSALKRPRSRKVSSGSLFYSRVVEQQVRAAVAGQEISVERALLGRVTVGSY